MIDEGSKYPASRGPSISLPEVNFFGPKATATPILLFHLVNYRFAMAGWQTDKRIFTTQKIKQGLRLVLCEIAYSMSIHSSQCTFYGFIKHILRKRNVCCCELQERTVGTYSVSNFKQGTCTLGKNWFQIGLTHPFRWMRKSRRLAEVPSSSRLTCTCI